MILAMFFMNLLQYLPLIIVYKTVYNPKGYSHLWWVGLVGVLTLLALSSWVYFSKKVFLNYRNNLIYFVIPLFLIIFLCVTTIFAIYNFALCFSLNILASLGFITLLILNFIPPIQKLNCFKITITLIVLLTFVVGFMFWQRECYVEFFTISVFIAVLFTYITFKLQNVYFEIILKSDINPEDQLIKKYSIAFMLIFVDMLVCIFKD